MLVTGGGFGIGTAAAFIIIGMFLYLFFRPYKECDKLDVNLKTSLS